MTSQKSLPPLRPALTQGTGKSHASSRFAPDAYESQRMASRKQYSHLLPVQTRNMALRTGNGKESHFLGVTWDGRHQTWIAELWNGQQYAFLGKPEIRKLKYSCLAPLNY